MRNNNYDTLSQASRDLEERGYTRPYVLRSNGIENTDSHKLFPPSSFVIDEFHRFEGDSNPSDMSIIFAVTTDNGEKGTIIHAYGTYEDPLESEMMHKLKLSGNG
jgi:hypothetical protein